jgi:hypothetical protein
MSLSKINLIPIQELTAGMVGAIRNQVIDQVVAQASAELSMPADKLIVRDIRPVNDIGMYSAGTTAATVERWVYDATTVTAGAFTTITGNRSMGDQRYVAIFGIRDQRFSEGMHTTDMGPAPTVSIGADMSFRDLLSSLVTFVKINVGGADKVIWDITSMYAYGRTFAAFSPTAVVIPQNSAFNLYYYYKSNVPGFRSYLQFIGVVVEPRGKMIT